MDSTPKKTTPGVPPPPPLGSRDPRAVPAPPVRGAGLTTPELVREIAREVILLGKKQIELSVAEAKADLKAEAGAAVGLGVAAVSAIVATTLLLVTVVLALARVMPAWGAGLVVSGFALLVAAVAGLMGWHRRVRAPLERTRRALREDVQVVKEGIA